MPDLQQLLEILHDLLADLDHLFVVIEAVEQSNRLRSLLDREDVGIPRRSLLKVVRTLKTDIRFEKVQLLITSCPNENIKATVSGISDSISMSNLGVEEDVKLFVKARLRSEPGFHNWPQNLRDDAERCLCQSVKRGFRWIDDTLDGRLGVPLDGLEDAIGFLREELVEFYPARKRKESDILAATMVIRMLWFMMKEVFLWEDTDEKVLSVAKMTQEIENIGFNNHRLLKFRCVEYKTNTGNCRQTPQTTEMQLRSIEELYEDRKCLISAMKNAERFISLIFGSDDEVWVARCYSIIRDRL
uniref:Uncharacterized protein n=1 Tax=Fusarium oxysporum (strain Fo5176) TaxID=660025 RepID=A0A0D2YF38_FUSOF